MDGLAVAIQGPPGPKPSLPMQTSVTTDRDHTPPYLANPRPPCHTKYLLATRQQRQVVKGHGCGSRCCGLLALVCSWLWFLWVRAWTH